MLSRGSVVAEWMWRCRYIVVCATLALVAVPALAAQYSMQSLGTGMPAWMENLPDVNDDGDVSLTSMVKTSNGVTELHATFHHSAGNVPLNVPGKSFTYAASLTERDTTGHVWVVGTAMSSLNQNDRTAMLWRVDGTHGGSPTAAYSIDLGALTSGSPQQSGAYGIVRDGSNLIVVGFTRTKVSSATLARPTVWYITVDSSFQASVTGEKFLAPGTVADNGSANSITSVGNTQYICGSSASGGGIYIQPTCWSGSWSGSYTKITDLSSKLANQLPGIVTGMAFRVRALDLKYVGVPASDWYPVVVGAVFQNGTIVNTQLSGGSWAGFAYDIRTGDLDTGFGLSGENSLAYDVRTVVFPEEAATANNHSRGYVVGGSSATTSQPDLTTPGPVDVYQVNTMRGVQRHKMTAGAITATGPVCKIDDDSEVNTFLGTPTRSSIYDQLVAMSRNGIYRLAFSEDKLLLLTNNDMANATVKVMIREATGITWSTKDGGAKPHERFVVRANYTQHADETEAILRIGKALSCQAVDVSNGGLGLGTTCNAPSQAAFDINAYVDISLTDTTANTGSLMSSELDKSFDATTFNQFKTAYNGTVSGTDTYYAQIASRVGNTCYVSKVMPLNDVFDYNPTTEFNNEWADWQDCGGSQMGAATYKGDYHYCNGCGKGTFAHDCSIGVANQVIDDHADFHCSPGSTYACVADGCHANQWDVFWAPGWSDPGSAAARTEAARKENSLKGGCPYTCKERDTRTNQVTVADFPDDVRGSDYAGNAQREPCNDDGSDCGDANCDGIDGDFYKARFVDDTDGNDTGNNCKKHDAPCKTIMRAIDQASAGDQVIIAGGNYTDDLVLKDGVHLIGGYDRNTTNHAWTRADDRSNANYKVTITGYGDKGGNAFGARGQNIKKKTVIQNVNIVAPDAPDRMANGSGGSSYGLWCVNCGGLQIRGSTITAGNGYVGQNTGGVGMGDSKWSTVDSGSNFFYTEGKQGQGTAGGASISVLIGRTGAGDGFYANCPDGDVGTAIQNAVLTWMKGTNNNQGQLSASDTDDVVRITNSILDTGTGGNGGTNAPQGRQLNFVTHGVCARPSTIILGYDYSTSSWATGDNGNSYKIGGSAIISTAPAYGTHFEVW